MLTFGNKLHTESAYYGFNITNRLATLETISSVVWYISSVTDPNASSMILDNDGEIVGNIIKVRLINGLAGHSYILSSTVTTSSNQVLVFEGLLTVE